MPFVSLEPDLRFASFQLLFAGVPLFAVGCTSLICSGKLADTAKGALLPFLPRPLASPEVWEGLLPGSFKGCAAQGMPSHANPGDQRWKLSLKHDDFDHGERIRPAFAGEGSHLYMQKFS